MKCIYMNQRFFWLISHQLIDWYISVIDSEERVFNNKTKKKKLKFFTTFCFLCGAFQVMYVLSVLQYYFQQRSARWKRMMSCERQLCHVGCFTTMNKKGFEIRFYGRKRERDMLFTTVHISQTYKQLSLSLSSIKLKLILQPFHTIHHKL